MLKKLRSLDQGRGLRARRFWRSCAATISQPTLYELFEAIERPGEIVSSCGKAHAEVRWHVEAVAGREQNSAFGGGLTEGAGIVSAHQPGEGRHAAPRRNPAEHVAMFGHR